MNLQTGIILYVGLMLAVLVGRFLYSQHKKKKTAAWLDQHPNAVKVYLKAYKLAWNGGGSIEIHTIDGEKPITFSEGMTTTGFYVLPGKHVVESSYFKQRSLGVVNTNTTYEATKQEIEVVGGKSYRYGFDEKTESYFFEEFDPA